MHLTHPFALALTLFSTSLLAMDGSIIFCNEANLTGSCTADLWFDGNSCYYIPDSNAKGDKGSSFRVTQGDAQCSLYTEDHCKGKPTPSEPWNFDIAQKKIYRTFMCWCTGSECPLLDADPGSAGFHAKRAV